MVLGSIQPLTEIRTMDFFCGVKAARAVGCQHFNLENLGSLKLLGPSGFI